MLPVPRRADTLTTALAFRFIALYARTPYFTPRRGGGAPPPGPRSRVRYKTAKKRGRSRRAGGDTSSSSLGLGSRAGYNLNKGGSVE